MTHKRHHSKKQLEQLERERCLKVGRRHTLYSVAVLVVCIGVAVYSADGQTTHFAAKVAELTAGAVGYWWLFGSLEL